MNLHQVIKGVVTTEKSVNMQEKNCYVFYVHKDATKIDIKIAIKEFWGANAIKVRIVKLPSKVRVMGRKGAQVKRNPKVKAYVTFKDSFDVLKFAGKKKKKAPAKKKTENNKKESKK